MKRVSVLVLFDFPVDQGLHDGPQEFLGDDIHDLRTHFVQDPLHDGFDEGGIRRAWLVHSIRSLALELLLRVAGSVSGKRRLSLILVS